MSATTPPGRPEPDGREECHDDSTSPGTELLADRQRPEALCPSCATPRPPAARFCEGCGLDLADPQTAGAWVLEVSVDSAHYELVAPDGMEFPVGRVEPVVFRLTETEVAIGRASASRGSTPAVDLSGPLSDPGVSHLHAVLVRSDRGYGIVDVGSTNGTIVNGEPLPPGAPPRRLADGDRVHVGVWTVIAVRASPRARGG